MHPIKTDHMMVSSLAIYSKISTHNFQLAEWFFKEEVVHGWQDSSVSSSSAVSAPKVHVKRGNAVSLGHSCKRLQLELPTMNVVLSMQ